MMKNITRYPILGMLFMLSSIACTAQSVLKITSEERAKYQEEVKHFVQETYYGSLQEFIADDVYRDYIIEKLMLESETKYKPEFSRNNTSDRYLTPLQYLQELSRSYSCYEEGHISISVDGIDVADSFFSHGLAGCYVEVTYRVSIKCKGKELQGGRCRMYCLFPNKAVRRDIRVLQIEPIIDPVINNESACMGQKQTIFDLEESFTTLLKKAKRGDSESQYKLGEYYFFGNGVTRNFREAVKWYRKAADAGFANAQNSLGACYFFGRGVPQNKKEGVKWYRKAADQGNISTMNNLGYCYARGEGVSKDKEEAKKWYKLADALGDFCAKYRISELNK